MERCRSSCAEPFTCRASHEASLRNVPYTNTLRGTYLFVRAIWLVKQALLCPTMTSLWEKTKSAITDNARADCIIQRRCIRLEQNRWTGSAVAHIRRILEFSHIWSRGIWVTFPMFPILLDKVHMASSGNVNTQHNLSLLKFDRLKYSARRFRSIDRMSTHARNRELYVNLNRKFQFSTNSFGMIAAFAGRTFTVRKKF